MSNYGNDSISELKDEQQVRKRPAIIFGTNDANGCLQSIFEIIDNSVDEARENNGGTIEINVTKDGIVSVKDNGRGVPMDWSSKANKFNWELVYCTLYASGKYDDSSYKESKGLNGLGSTASQYASEFMKVISVRDGFKYTMNFEKGKPVGELSKVICGEEPTGTEVIFKPDKEVFTDTDIAPEVYIDKLRRQAMLHSTTKFVFSYEGLNTITLHYEDGISGFIKSVCERTIIPEPLMFVGTDRGSDDEADDDPYDISMSVAFTFSRDVNVIEVYHNASFLSDGGITQDGLMVAMRKVLEDHARQSGKLAKGDKISNKDFEELIVAVVATYCPGYRTFYKNQTKTALGNPFIGNALAQFVYTNFSRWITENKALGDKIIVEVLANKEARESADAVKKKVLKKLSASVDSFGSRPAKFVPCESNNPFERELYIVEGDSAAGAVKQSRDGRFQAIMPVRGKIMNCLKEDLIRILKSEIIMDLLSVLGCGIEAKNKYVKDLPEFNIEKLYANKIIICTDADLDGKHIRCLVITMIYRLMPSLLRAGKVFIAETPLFEITAKKQTYFAYNESEKTQIINDLYTTGVKDSEIKIQRSKGLGENDPEMMSVSTMAPATRRLVPVEYPEGADEERAIALIFNALLGDDMEGRRYFIEEYFGLNVDID